MAHSTAGRGIYGGHILLTQMTGGTDNILESLYFGFYYHVWLKESFGKSPFDTGRWLCVSYRVGRLICYNDITHCGNVIYISTVQIVTNLYLATSNVTEIYCSFDANIHEKLKLLERD